MTQKKLKKKAFMIPMIQVELDAPTLNQLNKIPTNNKFWMSKIWVYK
jgi:hypothetical protein